MLKIQAELNGISPANVSFQISATPYQQEALRKFLDKPCYISISSRHSQRTLPQNKYLWSVVYPTIATDTGHTADFLHDFFKQKYLPVIRQLPNKLTGEILEETTGGTTTELSTVEFNEYIDKICLLAAEMGIYVPKPNEVSYD